MSSRTPLSDEAPETSPASRITHAVRRHVERLLQLEAAGSVLLVAAALGALIWANSPWSASYDALWRTPLSIGLGSHSVEITIDTIINDALMSVFFFGVGLEIRQELTRGELRDRRHAALPVIAAVGGMIVPAAIYLLFNRGTLANAWGIPIATDIAFAVGVLTLLRHRVDSSMRVFLLGLAITDDIGAVLVIGIFYSTALHLDGLAVALLGIAAIVALQRLGARRPITYALPVLVVWFGIYRAGVHPTIAGAIVGLMTPARPWPAPDRRFVPAESLGRIVQPWIAFFIMPLFAFANAGVRFSGDGLASAPSLVLGIGAALLLGKPLGIVAASALAVRTGIASLPSGLTWRGVMTVGVVAGVGFTMALFITDLALPAELQPVAKSAVLVSSGLAAAAALLIGRFALEPRPAEHRLKPVRRRFIPELERGPLAFVLLVVGVLSAAVELSAPDMVLGRAVLFVVVAMAGVLGVLRRRRAS